MNHRQSEFAGQFARRAVLAGGLGSALLCGLTGRLAHLQLRQGEQYRQAAQDNRIRLEPEPGARGLIYDRSGTILAGSRRDFLVTLIPENTPDAAGVLTRLARLIDLPVSRQARLLEEIAHSPGFAGIVVANNLSWEEFSRINAHAPALPGLTPGTGQLRSYPLGAVMAHPLGYVAKPDHADIARIVEAAGAARPQIRRLMRHPQMWIGQSGLEAAAEDWLSGTPGYRRTIVNANGRVIGELDSEDVAPSSGRPIVLSLDAAIQKYAMSRFGKQAGAAVVVHIESGQIIAFNSCPAYDPNGFVSGVSAPDYAHLRQDVRKPLFHKAHDGTYPPGSVFKPVVVAAALEAGVVDPLAEIHCHGHLQLGRRRFHCWKEKGHGPVNLHQALSQSCDIYFYELAMTTGPDRIAAMARRFGLGRSYALGLPGGASGLVPDEAWKRRVKHRSWMLGETLNLGIGQGYIHVTPLQLAVMAARLAGGPLHRDPQLILSGPRAEGPRAELSDSGFESLSPETMRRLQQALYAVTSGPGGTALRSGSLGFDGLRLAGKTGTAQVRSISKAEREAGLRPDSELARHLRDHALFIAYAPHDAPRYACAVIIEHGGSGSRVAAPIARDILALTVKRDPAARPVFTAPAQQAEMA